jgi:uncharacterized protein YutE (UPF0331/DUF86 family)
MDTTVVLRKLESLSRCIGRLESKTPDSAEILRADIDLQDIISINLERAVQISVDIASLLLSSAKARPPVTMAEAFAALADNGIISPALSQSLQKAVGFRNIAVHEYQIVDWERVFGLITTRLGDFRAFSKAVLGFLTPGAR